MLQGCADVQCWGRDWARLPDAAEPVYARPQHHAGLPLLVRQPVLGVVGTAMDCASGMLLPCMVHLSGTVHLSRSPTVVPCHCGAAGKFCGHAFTRQIARPTTARYAGLVFKHPYDPLLAAGGGCLMDASRKRRPVPELPHTMLTMLIMSTARCGGCWDSRRSPSSTTCQCCARPSAMCSGGSRMSAEV